MEKKTYQIGKVKQLIDLNGDSTNFEIKFVVTSKDKIPFDALVVDQTTLDNTPNLTYQKVEKGEIAGEIKQDKNIYQNYFLVLRSDAPCVCTVDIEKRELPKNIPQAVPEVKNLTKKSESSFNWTKLFLILGGVIVIGIGFYFYSKKKGTENTTEQTKAGFKFYSPPKFSGPKAGFNSSSSSSSSISPLTPPLPRFIPRTIPSSQQPSMLQRLKNLDSD